MDEGRPDEERALKAVIAEYEVLRAEIGRCQDHQVAILQFGFLVLGATAGLIGAIGPEGGSPDAAIVLLLVPIIYGLLAGLYADRLRRLIDVATYIEHSLREDAASLTRYPGVWGWEQWKCDSYVDLAWWRKAKLVLLDRMRWGIFVVPSVISVVAFWIVTEDLEGEMRTFGTALTILDCVLLVAVLAMILDADETTGIRRSRKDREGASTGSPSG